MEIIDGRKISEKIISKVSNFTREKSLEPSLAIIFVGNNPASKVYVEKKAYAGKQANISVDIFSYEQATTQQILDLVISLNNNAKYNGIILQLPAPNIDVRLITDQISTKKDVDGLNSANLGLLLQNKGNPLTSATALAIMDVLEYIAISKSLSLLEFCQGKSALVLNRSDLIGKPVSALLLKNNATVTIAHSYTENLPELTVQADIIISATGKRGLLKAAFIKNDAVIIDAGFNKIEGKIYGDVVPEDISEKAAWLSPVPYGVGPIGVARLLSNTANAAYSQLY